MAVNMRGSVVDYYKMQMPGLIDNMEESDLYTMLQFQVYKELPFVFTSILFESLSAYSSIARGGKYDINSYTKHFTVNIRDKETGYFNRYEYKIQTIALLLKMEESVYVDFYEYYVGKVNDNYYELELTNPKAHTSPLKKYMSEYHYVHSQMNWFLGKDEAKRLIEVYTDTFFTYLGKSKYGDIFTGDEVENSKEVAKTSIEDWLNMPLNHVVVTREDYLEKT